MPTLFMIAAASRALVLAQAAAPAVEAPPLQARAPVAPQSPALVLAQAQALVIALALALAAVDPTLRLTLHLDPLILAVVALLIRPLHLALQALQVPQVPQALALMTNLNNPRSLLSLLAATLRTRPLLF